MNTDGNQHNQQTEEQQPDSTAPTPRCGLFCWRPDFLQVAYNWKLGLTLICWFCFLHGVMANGFNAVNTSSLERNFDLDSQMIGWFASTSMFTLAGTTIITSYFADQTSNKPRMLALSSFCYVIGTLLMALPHFIMAPYKATQDAVPAMCYTDEEYLMKLLANMTEEIDWDKYMTVPECKDSETSRYFAMLIAGSAFQGVGSAILWTVGMTFIDDFSTTAASGLNIGISYLCDAVGSGVGFGLGSYFLSLDVNFDRKDVAPQYTMDPSFVGAWWLGYTIFIALFGTVTIGFLFFDNELPETAKLRPEKLVKVQTHVAQINVNFEDSNAARQNKFVRAVAAFLDHLLRVIMNPVVLWLTLAATIENLPVNGLQNFFVKLMQAQYNLSEMSAGIAMGVLIVVGIASGCLISGLITKSTHMSVRSMLLLIIIFSTIAFLLSFTMVLGCTPEMLVGVTYNVNSSSYITETKEFNESALQFPCNSACQCDAQYFSPVCHLESNLEFYSPCHAGCQHFGVGPSGELDYFQVRDCACLQNEYFNTSSVEYGFCSSNSKGCADMYGGLVALFFLLFCGFFIIVPVTECIMRTVALQERSFSLAFNQAIQYFLGFIPGPIFMGVIFDKNCLIRQPKGCKNKDGSFAYGACAVYNQFTLADWLTGILTSFSFVSIICYVIAFLLYKPPSGETLREYFSTFGKWWLKTCGCGRNKNDAERLKRHVGDSGHDGPYTITAAETAESTNGDISRPST